MRVRSWQEDRHRRYPKGMAWARTGPGPGRFAPKGASAERLQRRPARGGKAPAAKIPRSRPDGFPASQEAQQARTRLLATYRVYEFFKRRADNKLRTLRNAYLDLIRRQKELVEEDGPETELLKVQEQIVRNQMDQAKWHLRYKAYQFEQIRRMRRVLAVRDGIVLDVTTDLPRDDLKRRKQVQMALGTLGQMVSWRTVDEFRPKVRFRLMPDLEHGRAEFNWAEDEMGETVGEVRIDRYTGTKQMIHELGHYLEESDPDNFEAVRRFMDYRTAHQPVRPMAELDPRRAHGYDEDDWGQDGDFIDPYMGRLYVSGEPGPKANPAKRTGSELISMGFEYYFYEPQRLAREDPELFEFLYDLTHGYFDSEHQ